MAPGTRGNLRTVRKATLEAARFAAAGAEASRVLGETQGTLALHLLTFDLPLLHRRLPTCTRTDNETNERRPSGSKAGTENWTPRAFKQNTAVATRASHTNAAEPPRAPFHSAANSPLTTPAPKPLNPQP